jgi:hypothetical protein
MSRIAATLVTLVTLVALTLTAGAPRSDASASRPVNIVARVALSPGGGASLLQRGRFSGAPLGSGAVAMRTSLGGRSGAAFRFEMRTARGSVRGSGRVALSFRGGTVVYRGTAGITSGTGAFARLRARGLRVAGRGALSGDTFAVRISGRGRM